MARIGRWSLWLVLGLALSACTQAVRPEDPFAGYPFRHKVFDLHFGWKTVPTAAGIQVDGVVKNVRYFQVGDLMLTLSLLDGGGTVLARDSFIFIPFRLPQDDTAPFSINLTAVPPPGARIQFLYRYRPIEGGMDGDGGFWMHLFTVDAATGAVFRSE